MIVLDEQLGGRGIETVIQRWYPGSVKFITELRPQSVIKDEAVDLLLRRVADATFVTINIKEFWLKLPGSPDYCIVCVAVQDEDAHLVPALLRRVMSHSLFNSKAKRAGKIVRVSQETGIWYSLTNRQIQEISGWTTPHKDSD